MNGERMGNSNEKAVLPVERLQSPEITQVQEAWERLRPFLDKLSIAKHIDNVLDEIDAVFQSFADGKKVFAELRSILYRISQVEKKILIGDSDRVLQDLLTALMSAAGRGNVSAAKTTFEVVDAEWSKEFEFQEAIIKSRLEVMLEEHAEYLNKGDNAVIFKIDLTTFSDDERTQFEDINPDLFPNESNAAAVKVLKFYRKGDAAKELHAHNTWFQMIATHPERDTMAWVPRPADAFDIYIEEESEPVPEGATPEQAQAIQLQNQKNRDRINALVKRGFPYMHGHNGEESSARVIKGELFMMDYIPGKDLATVMMEWIIDHPPENMEAFAVKKKNMTKQELRQQVVDLLGLHFDDSDVSPHEMKQHLQQVDWYSQQAIYKHLKATGFRINPSLVSQIEKTAAAAKQAGLFHRDAHEGNIILTGDYLGEEAARAYVIDFGENTDTETKELEGIVGLLKSFQS